MRRPLHPRGRRTTADHRTPGNKGKAHHRDDGRRPLQQRRSRRPDSGALVDAGVDVEALSVDDLAPVDAFHIRGREATEELAALVKLADGQKVLDAGCGIGGTSRYLADRFGCSVVGVDLTPEHCDVAAMLSARVGLADRNEFHAGSVLELPFEDDHFDVAWDRARADEHRRQGGRSTVSWPACWRPGGTLAFHDIFAGPEPDLHFPVPWASEAAISHLIPIEDLRTVLGRAGFSQLSWEDKTGASTEFFEQVAAQEPSALGVSVLMRDAEVKIPNLLRNLKEGRVCVVQAVMKKPSGNRS